MARDLAIACRPVRLVTKQQSANREGRGRNTAEPRNRPGIMISRDPYPVTTALKQRQRGPILVHNACRSAVIMETVAERNHGSGGVAGDDTAEPRKRCRCIIGRQQDTAFRKG